MNADTKITFEKTSVPCLMRRRGPTGDTFYGRVKRFGKLHRTKLGDNFTDAKRKLAKWLEQIDVQNGRALVSASSASTWGEFAQSYLNAIDYDVALADKTKSYRHECINRIITSWWKVMEGEIEDLKVTAITRDLCQIWAAHIVYYHPTTYNNTIATMKHVLDLAVEAGLLPFNPAGKLKRVAKLNRRLSNGVAMGEPGQQLTPEEQEHLETQMGGPRWYPSVEEFKEIVKEMRSQLYEHVQDATDFCELLAYTGCRLSEGRRLRWGDVNWQDNTILVNGAKGRASSFSMLRHVPISDALADLLHRMEAKQPNHKPEDNIAKVKRCRGTLQAACVRLGFRKLDHHDLRHWFTTRAVANNVPIPIVADWLGHKDGGVLLMKVYRHQDSRVSQQWAASLLLKEAF